MERRTEKKEMESTAVIHLLEDEFRLKSAVDIRETLVCSTKHNGRVWR